MVEAGPMRTAAWSGVTSILIEKGQSTGAAQAGSLRRKDLVRLGGLPALVRWSASRDDPDYAKR